MNIKKYILTLGVSLPLCMAAQKVGINNATPTGLLSLPDGYGKKISFWGDANGAHYGMGVDENGWKIFSDASFTYIVFGTGSSSAFTEFMRINGSGQVGLGTTSPQYNLDVAGNMRISSYSDLVRNQFNQPAPQYVPGALYLNGQDNTTTPALLSLNNGWFGWYRNSDNRLLFGFNPSGAMVLNGSTGTAGQVLMSRGFVVAPAWENDVLADMYANQQVGWAANPAFLNDGSFQQISFVNSKPIFGSESPLVISINSATKVLVKWDLVGSAACCAPGFFQLNVMDNGAVKRSLRYTIAADQTNTISGSTLITMAAGDHNISLQLAKISGSNLVFTSDNPNGIFSMITVSRITGKVL